MVLAGALTLFASPALAKPPMTRVQCGQTITHSVRLTNCLVALAPAVGPRAKRQFRVTSTIDGKTVLPHRIHWLAFPSLRASKIAKVDFLIDGGKVRWTEHGAPYNYGSDENGKKLGYLVTSWLSAGRHRFIVRATAKDGRVATHTVVARVMPAPEPPAGLAGSWQRTIDTAAAPKPGTPANPTETFTPSGTYSIAFERRWIRDDFPGKFILPDSNKTGNGFIFLSDYTPGPTRFHVQGEVIFHPPSESLAEGGWWCYSGGPGADYRWSVSSNTLTLTPIGGKDACPIRGFIWTGNWTRVR